MNAILGCMLFMCLFIIVCILVLVALWNPKYYNDNQADANDDTED